MSLLEELERINEIPSPEELLKVDEKRGLAEQDERLRRIREITGPRMSGKGSWYSQLPQYGWVDREDKPGSNALGVKDEEQGIALPSRKTLGQWFDVTFPNGETHRLQQTDVGPAQWTGKGIDISAAAAHKAGYKPDNFPTGGGFTWSPAEGDAPTQTAAREFPDTASPTGQKRMANGDEGILPFLGMKQQSPQGLLGALSDPETMAYIGMALKGLSPYSSLDPGTMLSNAHTMAMRKQALQQQLAENARDNARADERLKFDRERHGFTRQEHEEQKAQAERERKAREDFYSGQAGASQQPTTTAEPVAAPAAAPQSEYDKIRERIKYFEDRLGTLGQKDQQAAQKQIDVLKKRLEPTATELNQYTKSSAHLPELESLKRDLTRAQELVPEAAGNAVTTYFNKLFSGLGVGSPEADKTAELDRKMQQIALSDLKKLLPGPSSDRDRDAILRIAANPGTPRAEKAAQIANVLQRVEDQVSAEKGAIKRFRQKEGTYKPEEEAAGGGDALPGGWTVRKK